MLKKTYDWKYNETVALNVHFTIGKRTIRSVHAEAAHTHVHTIRKNCVRVASRMSTSGQLKISRCCYFFKQKTYTSTLSSNIAVFLRGTQKDPHMRKFHKYFFKTMIKNILPTWSNYCLISIFDLSSTCTGPCMCRVFWDAIMSLTTVTPTVILLGMSITKQASK